MNRRILGIKHNRSVFVMIEKIISGGQTGADRAGLDIAIRHGFSHSGWCPKGQKAEDGPIGGQYRLIETPSANYLQRTELKAGEPYLDTRNSPPAQFAV